MKFLAYIPYSQLDLNVIESTGGFIEEFYPTLEELQEEHGKDCEWTITQIDGLTIQLDDDNWLSMEDISEN